MRGWARRQFSSGSASIAVVVTEISLITPPVGLNVFVLSGVLKDVRTSTVFKGVTPFWCADIGRLALLVAFPRAFARPAAAVLRLSGVRTGQAAARSSPSGRQAGRGAPSTVTRCMSRR